MNRLRLLTLALLFSFAGFAQPANDSCAVAAPLIMGGPETCVPVTGDLTGGSNSGLTPGCANYSGADIWYTLTVPSTGLAIIETSADTGATAITDGGMAVYTGDCNNLTLLECDDDGGAGLFSLIELSGLTPGDQLFVVVWRYGGSQEGTVNICAYQPPVCPDIDDFTFDSDSTSVDYISVTWESFSPGSTYTIEYGPTGFTPGSGTTVTGITGTDGPPVAFSGLDIFTQYDFYLSADCGGGFATDTIMETFSTSPGLLTNDDCDTATPLVVNGPNDCQPFTSFNDGATDSGIPHPCANYQGGDVWFSFVAPSSGGVFVETSSAGGFGDGGMALYSGNCTDSLNLIECNDDGGEGLFSLIEAYDLTPGETYYVAVWEYGGDTEGAFNICAYAPPTCPSPAQFSFFVDSVTSSEAWIQWTTNNDGADFVIEYGPGGFTPGTGTTVTGVVGVDGPPAHISGLDPETIYDYYYQGICAPGDSTDFMGPYFLQTLPTCASPNFFDISTDTTGFDMVSISWGSFNPGATFIIEYGEPGFEPGTGSTLTGIVGVDGPPVTIAGLFLGTGYELYIQEACSSTDSTQLVGPYGFETLSLPPENDDLCDAIEILVSDPATAFSNEGATLQAGEPQGSCWTGANTPDAVVETVWFTFTAMSSDSLTLTSFFENAELTDTHIAVYTLEGDCNDPSNLVEVACGEDESGFPSYSAILQLDSIVEGQQYYIQVDGWGDLDGEFMLDIYEGLVGLEEASQVDFNLYPNPAENMVTISSAFMNGSVTIEVMDLNGRLAYAERTILESNRPATIDISELEAGVYMIRLLNADGFSVQRMIVE